MSLYKKTIDEKTYDKCFNFAQKCVKTNIDEYTKRKQNNIDKIIDDILVGKLGEYGVYSMMLEKGFELKEPDLMIYDKYNKSFEADLKTDKYNIHVKSQKVEQKSIYTLSWLFQSNDILVTKPQKNDIIVFCEIDNRDVNVIFYQRAKIFKTLYRDPIKKSLIGNKKVIYYSDINDAINNKKIFFL